VSIRWDRADELTKLVGDMDDLTSAVRVGAFELEDLPRLRRVVLLISACQLVGALAHGFEVTIREDP
jgi:hypothetical protein